MGVYIKKCEKRRPVALSMSVSCVTTLDIQTGSTTVSLSSQSIGRMPDGVRFIRTQVLTPVLGDSDDVRKSAGDVRFHPRRVR